MDPRQESDIARGLRQGKAEAWLALYDAYAERIWQYVAWLMGQDSADVADVVQETFMAAARTARRMDDFEGSLWHWLYGIMRNHVALHYRRQARQDRLKQAGDWLAAGKPEVIRWLQNREPLPTEALEAAELKTTIQEALLAIPSDYENLLTSKYLNGDSVEQIAVEANCTVTAVRSKLARARKAFREAFVKDEADYSF
jgi:RNA polymerase sigma-70 factor, ECF subfamily